MARYVNPIIHTAALLSRVVNEGNPDLPCWLAFLSSLKLISLFVAEREQTLKLVNRWNVQLQDPADSGCSPGAKKSSR